MQPAEHGHFPVLAPRTTHVAGRNFLFLATAHFGLLLMLITVAAAWFGAAVAAPALTFLVATAFVGLMLHVHYPHGRLGLCNAVTHLRLTLATLLTAVLVRPEVLAGDEVAAWAVVGLATACLALDGVDGWLARREGLSSAFGARFDVEVDAALALTLSIMAWRLGVAGPWVLALGLPRYLFIAAQRVWPWLKAALPERRRRKVVCAVQIMVLIALLCPGVPKPLMVPLAGLAAGALLASFAADTLWLMRRARSA
jgi:phosphatidylglycerophosphate synthase